jgi:hypothetical protein
MENPIDNLENFGSIANHRSILSNFLDFFTRKIKVTPLYIPSHPSLALGNLIFTCTEGTIKVIVCGSRWHIACNTDLEHFAFVKGALMQAHVVRGRLSLSSLSALIFSLVSPLGCVLFSS